MWSGGGGAPGWGGWNWNAGAGADEEGRGLDAGARAVNGGVPPLTLKMRKMRALGKCI